MVMMAICHSMESSMSLEQYLLFWVCIAGLCLGSFFNVVILRSLSNESIVFPSSKCPKCNHKLYWWHNIPILSYILLRGKCYFCKEKISIQYPIVEFVTMLLFGISFWQFGLSIRTLFILIIFSCFIIMTTTDIKEKLVDCNIAIGLGFVGMIYAYYTGGIEGFIYSAAGLSVGALILETIARTGYLFTKSRAMGEADTYVAGAIGACFGIYNIIPILLYSLIASMIFVLPVFLYNKFKAGDKMTCIMAVLFTISILVFHVVAQTYFTLGFLAISGSLLAYSIMKNIKTEENRNYLPFVPALAAGVLYYITFCF